MGKLLTDRDLEPTNDVVAEAMGPAWLVWQQLIVEMGHRGITVGWRYYQDSKAWLGKCVKGAKTIVWVSVWPGYFQASLYFAARLLPDEKPTMANMVGRHLDVHSAANLPEVLDLIDFKLAAR